MKKSNAILTTVIILLFSFEMYSQTSSLNFNFSMTYISTGQTHELTSSSDPGTGSSFMSDTIYTRTCIVDLLSTGGISTIHINVGTDKDSSDVFDYSIVYNDSLNLPENVSYFSEGNKIYLGLFKTLKTDMYHYKVRLEGFDGELSEPKYFY